MANDTIVEYILKVDAKGAERALDRTGNEAKETATQFDRLEQSTTQASQGMQRLERQANSSTAAARNFRRAGRDLDGALGDLAQGVGVLSPQMGHLLMEVSNGASIVEGLGRSMTLFLNPAVAAAAALTVGAGLALAAYEAEQQATEERAKALAKVIDDTNKIIDEQSKVSQSASDSLANYTTQIENARTRLELLTGQITQFEADQRRANQEVEQYAQGARSSSREQITAIEETVNARQKQIRSIQVEIALLKQKRAIEQSLSERLAGTPQQFAPATQQEKQLEAQLQPLLQAQQADQTRLKTAEDQRLVVESQVYEYQKILEEQNKIAEADRRRQEAERRRQEALRKEAELERQFAQLEKEAADQAKKALDEQQAKRDKAIKARQQIEAIIQQAQTNSLSVTDRINQSYDEQIRLVKQLGRESGAQQTALVAINALEEERNSKLDEAIQKQNELNKKESEARAKQKEDEKKQIKDDRQAQIDQGAQIITSIATLDVGAIANLISPAVGAITNTLIAVGEKSPQQIKEEALAQVNAIAKGLEYLPAIFIEIAPQIAIAIVEALSDGLINLFINIFEIIKKRFQWLFGLRDRSPDQSKSSRRDARRQAISAFFDPSQSYSYASGGNFLPKAQGGIRFTGAQDGLAMLHRGEFVVPQSGQRPQQVDRQMQSAGSGMIININSAVVDRNAVDALVREIEIRFNNQFGVSSSNLFGGR